jgi:hypothetical protein
MDQPQFEAMAEHNGWTHGDKAAYLIAAMNEPATHILHSVPTGMPYEEITAVLENRYGDHHLAEAFHTQLRRKVQHTGESVQESAVAIDHLARHAYEDSTEQHISWDAAVYSPTG